MKLQPFTTDHRLSGAKGAAARWASEFAKEQWALDPLDRLTAAQFEQMLVAKFGAPYLGPVEYERMPDGTFCPARSPAKRIRGLFRQHPCGLTRLQIKRLTGLPNGAIARIVSEPAYTAVGSLGTGRTLSVVWAPSERD